MHRCFTRPIHVSRRPERQEIPSLRPTISVRSESNLVSFITAATCGDHNITNSISKPIAAMRVRSDSNSPLEDEARLRGLSLFKQNLEPVEAVEEPVGSGHDFYDISLFKIAPKQFSLGLEPLEPKLLSPQALCANLDSRPEKKARQIGSFDMAREV